MNVLKTPRLIVAARALAGLSQLELAQAAGVSLSVLKAIEQGQSDPKLSTVNDLTDALRAKGVEFCTGTQTMAWGICVARGSEAETASLDEAVKRRP
jgi:predicted transcriptional regulator